MIKAIAYEVVGAAILVGILVWMKIRGIKPQG
jgi:hypothetical protein